MARCSEPRRRDARAPCGRSTRIGADRGSGRAIRWIGRRHARARRRCRRPLPECYDILDRRHRSFGARTRRYARGGQRNHETEEPDDTEQQADLKHTGRLPDECERETDEGEDKQEQTGHWRTPAQSRYGSATLAESAAREDRRRSADRCRLRAMSARHRAGNVLCSQSRLARSKSRNRYRTCTRRRARLASDIRMCTTIPIVGLLLRYG